MAPKVVPCDGSVHFTFGLPISAWLNKLNTSARKLRPIRSVRENRLSSDRSTCQRPGARTAFRGALPHWPSAGAAKAYGLSHRSARWFLGYKGWPGTILGRWLLLRPSGRADALRLRVTFAGKPVRAVPIPLHCQPPRSEFTTGDALLSSRRPLPTGRIQIALVVKLWRISKSVSPYSQARQLMF